MLYVSLVCGLLYLFTQPWLPYPGSFAIKGLSIAALAILAFRRAGGAHTAILGVALTSSAIGDVLLDLDPQHLFVFGLASFLIAHVVYIVLWTRNWKRPLRVPGSRMALLVAVVVFSASFLAWLIPSLGSLTEPVLCYVGAITVMVVTAILAGFSRPWVAFGAILFLISDSLLAADKFRAPVPYRDFLVWSTYYFGQLAIAVGFLEEKSAMKKSYAAVQPAQARR